MVLRRGDICGDVPTLLKQQRLLLLRIDCYPPTRQECRSLQRRFIFRYGSVIIMLTHSKLKALIELSETNIQADEYIEKYTGYKDIAQKFPFIQGMFEEATPISKSTTSSQTTADIMKDDYYAALQFIVNKKWR